MKNKSTYTTAWRTKFARKTGKVSRWWRHQWYRPLFDVKQLRFKHFLLSVFLLRQLLSDLFVCRPNVGRRVNYLRFTRFSAPKLIGTCLEGVKHVCCTKNRTRTKGRKGQKKLSTLRCERKELN